MNKLQAICKFLDTDYSENSDDCAVSENYPRHNVYAYLNEEYLVLTNEEADEMCKEYILDSLWTFKADFLTDYMRCLARIPSREIESFEKNIKIMQQTMCENCNEIIKALIKDDLDEFIHDAMKIDGRGHFLATYDGEEIEEGEYFIYQI